MKFENGTIKPCSRCLKARQAAKDAVMKLAGMKQSQWQEITTTLGTLWVNTSDRTVAGYRPKSLPWDSILGRKVYIAGKQLIDVELANTIYIVGSIISVLGVDARS